MNLMTVMNRFPDEKSCIAHLEKIRWGDNPQCPYCESDNVARKRENDKRGRWNCHLCKSSFNVLAKTMFQGTKVPLQKWFIAIVLVANAKKSVSSCQLGRDIDLNQRSAWYMLQRIRTEMARKDSIVLKGIIEADETFMGGKPRRRKDKDGNLPPPSKRGRGTKKTKVLGAVERGGKVVARVVTDLSGSTIMKFVASFIRGGSRLVTDEYKGYLPVKRVLKHDVVQHSKYQYVDAEDPTIHTNTIEGFWSLLKRAWHGQHHHYSKEYAPLYVAEACYKYNRRKTKDLFEVFLAECFR